MVFLEGEDVSGRYVASRMEYILFARNDNGYIRCRATMEVIEYQYRDDAQNPSRDTIRDLEGRFSKLHEKGYLSEPNDDFKGRDIILTTENFSYSR